MGLAQCLVQYICPTFVLIMKWTGCLWLYFYFLLNIEIACIMHFGFFHPKMLNALWSNWIYRNLFRKFFLWNRTKLSLWKLLWNTGFVGPYDIQEKAQVPGQEAYTTSTALGETAAGPLSWSTFIHYALGKKDISTVVLQSFILAADKRGMKRWSRGNSMIGAQPVRKNYWLLSMNTQHAVAQWSGRRLEVDLKLHNTFRNVSNLLVFC